MMKACLYWIVGWISRIHSYILRLNDKFEYNFSDKELHFIVIGIIGMIMIVAIYPLFKYLAKKDRILTITWIYVFTLIIVLTFAIEIGQKITGTGLMEFSDIMFGVVGFLAMFMIYAGVRAIIFAVGKWVDHLVDKDNEQSESVDIPKTKYYEEED